MSFAVTSPDYSGGVPADQTDDFHGGGGVSPGDDHGGGVPADETDDIHGSGGVPADTPMPLPDGGPYTETVDGIEWTFMVTNGEASVGTGLHNDIAISQTISGKIAVPSTLGGRSVTSISDYALCRCDGLTSVTIPEGVMNIGYYAFYNCRGLTSVTIPSSVTSIGSSAFWNCFKLTSVTIPEGVTSIEVGAFRNCTVLTSITIPDSVTSIGGAAFRGCRGLTNVTIPEGVTNIGSSAFNSCSRLASVTFEGDAPMSGDGIFEGTPSDMVVHVKGNSSGWTQWNGRVIRFDADAGSGASATSVNVNMTITNVVVQYVLNSVQPEIAVPVSGDTGFTTIITEVKSAGAVSVPSEWKDNYPAFESKFGADFVKALMWKTGKKDGANNDMFVWQDFVAGTDPTNPNDKFTASITMADGVPVISYTPELSDEQKALREYKTFGKRQLQDKDWTDITNFDGEAKKSYNFFKVTVEMR